MIKLVVLISHFTRSNSSHVPWKNAAFFFALQAVFSRLKDEAQMSEDTGHSARETGSTGQQMPRLWAVEGLCACCFLFLVCPKRYLIFLKQEVNTWTLSTRIPVYEYLGMQFKLPS